MVDLVQIRMILTGGKQVATEADLASTSIAKTGTAAATASKRSAVASAGLMSTLKKQGAAMRALGGTMTKYLTVPIAAIGIGSAIMAAKFERSMLLVHTQAGASRKELHYLEKGVLELGKTTPQGPEALSAALFRLRGAGIKGKEAMDALKASSELAMVGHADVEDTAKTLSQVWFTGIKGAKNFRTVVAEINATVGAGDLRLQALVDALGTGVLGAAKLAGLSLQDVTAAMAVFGDETNNVSGWSAQFATALHFFTSPGDKASAAMEKLGLRSHQLSEDFAKPHGLVAGLKDLKSHLEALPGGIEGTRAKDILGEILPGGRGRVIAILMNQLDRLEEKYKQIHKTAHEFSKSVEEARGEDLTQLEIAWSNIRVIMIELGKKLLPIIIPFFMELANGVKSVAEWFSNLSPELQKVIMFFFVALAVAGPILVFLGSLATAIAALEVLATPLTATAAVVLALGVAFYVAYHKVRWFHNAVDAVVQTMGGWVNAVAYVIRIFSPLAAIVLLVIGHFNWLKNAGTNAFNWIKGAAQTLLTFFTTNPIGKVIAAPFVFVYEKVKWLVGKVEDLYGTVKEIVEFGEGILGEGTVKNPSINRNPNPTNPIAPGPHGTMVPPPVVTGGNHRHPHGHTGAQPRRNTTGVRGRPTAVTIPVILNGRQIAEANTEIVEYDRARL